MANVPRFTHVLEKTKETEQEHQISDSQKEVFLCISEELAVCG